MLWRLNWIHPFGEGNGRTARVISYVVLCVRVGFLLPGTKTIPQQIDANKTPYYDALREADLAWSKKELDLSEMETLLEQLLATQLAGVIAKAKEGS